MAHRSIGEFRVYRIANPDSLWIGCPYTVGDGRRASSPRCHGLEVPNGATMAELVGVLRSHLRAHGSRDGPPPRVDPHRAGGPLR